MFRSCLCFGIAFRNGRYTTRLINASSYSLSRNGWLDANSNLHVGRKLNACTYFASASRRLPSDSILIRETVVGERGLSGKSSDIFNLLFIKFPRANFPSKSCNAILATLFAPTNGKKDATKSQNRLFPALPTPSK